jgi:hypothetical protein
MKKWIRTGAVLALGWLLALPLFAASFGQRISSNTVAATTSNSAVTCSDAAGAFNATTVDAINTGPSLVYVEFNSTTAVAASATAVPVPSGSNYRMTYDSIDAGQGAGMAGVGVITGASTATVYVVCKRPKSGS